MAGAYSRHLPLKESGIINNHLKRPYETKAVIPLAGGKDCWLGALKL